MTPGCLVVVPRLLIHLVSARRNRDVDGLKPRIRALPDAVGQHHHYSNQTCTRNLTRPDGNTHQRTLVQILEDVRKGAASLTGGQRPGDRSRREYNIPPMQFLDENT